MQGPERLLPGLSRPAPCMQPHSYRRDDRRQAGQLQGRERDQLPGSCHRGGLPCRLAPGAPAPRRTHTPPSKLHAPSRNLHSPSRKLPCLCASALHLYKRTVVGAVHACRAGIAQQHVHALPARASGCSSDATGAAPNCTSLFMHERLTTLGCPAAALRRCCCLKGCHAGPVQLTTLSLRWAAGVP